jgi:hypothetical protein
LGEEGLVGEDAIEGGAGDLELAGGAELVSSVEIEDVLDVLLDDGVEREVIGVDDGVGLGGAIVGVGQGKVFRADDAICGLEESGFEDGGEFADIAGPVVLEESGEGTGAEEDGSLLVAEADALEQGLGEWGDVFAAEAEGWNGEADGGEAEGEVREQESLSGHLAERGLGGGEEDSATGRAVLESFEDGEEETLSGRGEEVDAVEEGESGEGGGVGVGDEPFAGIAALKTGVDELGTAEQVACEGMLASALLAFNGGDLDVWGGHFSLGNELSPGGADADELDGLGRFEFEKGEAVDWIEAGVGGVDLSGGGHRSKRGSPPFTRIDYEGPKCISRPTSGLSAVEGKA